MIVHDITQIIPDDIVNWPGDPPATLTRVCDLARGDPYTLHRLSCSAHIGTHLDAPAHFIAGGGDILSVPLEDLIGEAWVISLAGPGEVLPDQLAYALSGNAPRVLLRPERLGMEVWLGEAAASALIEHNVRLVGTTCPSIDDPRSTDWPAHRLLLGAGCSVLENCRLDDVTPGQYFLVCMPLRWRGAEASPVRAVLLEGSLPIIG